MPHNDTCRRIAIVLLTLALACGVMVPGRGLHGQSAEIDSRRPPGAPLTDWSLFPQAYSLLLNERLVLPTGLSLWRMKIDTSRQLFTDNYLIARVRNVEREFHAVRKHPDNPVLRDLTLPYIFSDPGGGYRLYGSAYGEKFGGLPAPVLVESSESSRIMAAHSGDGLRWRPLERRVMCRPGSSAPWREMHGQIHGLFLEPQDPDPVQRWKMLVGRDPGIPDRPLKEPFGVAREEDDFLAPIVLYASPDGWQWTRKCETALLEGNHAFQSRGFPSDSPPQRVGDVLIVRWDPALRKYVAHTKLSVGPDWRFPFARVDDKGALDASYEARASGWRESDDLVHWSSLRVYAYPDNQDTRISGMYGIYEASGFRYQSLWLGWFSMSANIPGDCGAEPRHPVGYKRNWIRLAGSCDRRTWYYLGAREAFIPNGPDDQWDAHYVKSAQVSPEGPTEMGDELWFYYTGVYGGIPGCPGLTLPKDNWRASLGIGRLRRDGFSSLNASEQPAEVITRPLVFEGTGVVFVNAAAKYGGYVKLSVLDEEGTPLGGFRESECIAFEGDSVRARISWRRAETLVSLKGRYSRLAFHFRKARLYSFWVE